MRNVLADACEDKSFAAHPPQLVALRLDFNWNRSREAILLTQLQWLQLGVHSHDSRKWFQEHLREPLPSGNSRSIPLPVVTALGGTGQLVFDVMILPCQKSKLKFHPKIQRNDGGSREKRVADEHACTGGGVIGFRVEQAQMGDHHSTATTVTLQPLPATNKRISRSTLNEYTYIHIDWCCFYYFVRNSLVSLLEALCARYIHDIFVQVDIYIYIHAYFYIYIYTYSIHIYI